MLQNGNVKIDTYCVSYATDRDMKVFRCLLAHLPQNTFGSSNGFTCTWHVHTPKNSKLYYAHTLFQVQAGTLDQTENIGLTVEFPKENLKNFTITFVNDKSRRLVKRYDLLGLFYDRLSDVYNNLPD